MQTVNGLPAHVLLVHAVVVLLLTTGLTVVAVLVSGAAVYDVVRIGDSGAKASWNNWAARP